nr:MAG TPA: YopX protein [Caudoviricetes sp.]
MERLTYVAENGEVLFHPADLPDDEGITITQLAKDGRYKALEEIAERLANREQAEEQGLLLWLPCKARFDVRALGCNFPMTLDECVDDISVDGLDYEVLGNKFDNPELLEVQE